MKEFYNESYDGEPERVIRFEHNGISFEMNPENSAAYLFEDDPRYDHIYYVKNSNYVYLFREQVSNLDDVVDYMEDNDFNVYIAGTPSREDREEFEHVFGEQMIKLRNLTEREEKEIQFARYLLDNDKVEFGS